MHDLMAQVLGPNGLDAFVSLASVLNPIASLLIAAIVFWVKATIAEQVHKTRIETMNELRLIAERVAKVEAKVDGLCSRK